MKFVKYLYVFAIGVGLALPLLSPIPLYAQQNGNQNSAPQQHVQVKLDNPLGATKSVPELVRRFLNIVLKIGVPIVVLAIIWTGYLFIAARGNPDGLKKAKDSLMYTLIGAFILLGAYAIAEAVVSTINAIRS